MSKYELGSEAEWEAFMDASQTVIQLKAGQTLTQDDVDALRFAGEFERREEERAIDAFHRGRQIGIEEAAGKDAAALHDKISGLVSEVATQRAMRQFDRQSGFWRGAQACREMMARFVEQGGDSATANSIRLNWHPGWGRDPGALDGEIPLAFEPKKTEAA